MYLFNRAFAYIRKQKAKTILLLVLFFIIANIVLAGLSIQSATEAAKILTRQEIGADIIYTFNTSKLNTDFRSGVIDANADRATLEGAPLYQNLDVLLNSDLIQSYDVVSSYEVTTDVWTPYVYTASSTTTTTGTGQGAGKAIIGAYTSSGDLSLRTFTRPIPTDFVDETSSLLEGRHATQEEIDTGAYVILIEKTLADLNQIKVGDRIDLTPTLEGYDTNVLAYEVIGIYQSNEILDDRSASMIGSSLLPQNRLYTPFTTLTSMGYSNEDLDNVLLDKAVITLKDPMDVDAYMASVEDKLNLVYGTLSANDAVYEQLAGPIDTLGQMSNVLVLIVVIAGAAILSLITALTINQRKNEIG
ncbi:MAG: ABC transporter permease, partial [Bacilli bacterium]|nr:ABC transporter permease [Bacilli bacterium]